MEVRMQSMPHDNPFQHEVTPQPWVEKTAAKPDVYEEHEDQSFETQGFIISCILGEGIEVLHLSPDVFNGRFNICGNDNGFVCFSKLCRSGSHPGRITDNLKCFFPGCLIEDVDHDSSVVIMDKIMLA